MKTARFYKMIFPVVLFFGVALWVASLWHGSLNQDEGWYLLASLRTAKGQVPCRDFFFTQGPVMPYVYGLLSPFWASSGLLGGRIVSAMFGLAAVGMAGLLAARLAPARRAPAAALTVWLLTAWVPVHAGFSVVPKTYSLAAFLLLAGFLRVSRGAAGAFSGGLLTGLAVATRISLGPVLPCVWLFLLPVRRKSGWQNAWLYYGLGAGMALLLTYGVILLVAGDAFLYSQFYHATRSSGGFFAWAVLRAGFVSRSLQAYPLLWIAALGLLVRALPGGGLWRAAGTIQAAAGWSVAAVTALHLASPFPYDDYQTPVMPLLAAVTAAVLWQSIPSDWPEILVQKTILFVAGAAFLMALGSPLLMEWRLIRKDRFWFQQKSKTDLQVLREVGRWIRSESPPGSQLLTQDAYLAVEAGRDVPPGLEMGPFSLFPELTDEEAQRFRVHNLRTLRRVMRESTAPLAALSGYSFALACPGTDPLDEGEREALFDEMRQYYEPVREVPDFGQAHTTLTILRRR